MGGGLSMPQPSQFTADEVRTFAERTSARVCVNPFAAAAVSR